jgi:hypothetical protein
VVVVEFLVAVADAGLGEALGEDARAIVDVVLVAPAAVDGDAAQCFEIFAGLRDQVYGIVAAPVAPALCDDFAGFGVEGDAEAERSAS